jgi:membrane fusion protein (multidrug efflux system)
VLRLTPGWTRATYWLLAAALAFAAAYLGVGTIHEYATGPAVVWMADALHVTATAGGTVSEIEVMSGQSVEAGDLLVRFSSPLEQAELSRVDREFELQLAAALRDPANQTARAAVAELRTQRDVAAARLELRSIRAPRAGRVGDVRIRPGQLIDTGQIVLTLQGPPGNCSVVAMISAQYGPQVRPGSAMRFEVTGYRYAYQDLTVTSVGTQVIGPREVQRYLGEEIGDTVSLTGPLVLVEAAPRSCRFDVDGQSFEMHHGMSGSAQLRVRSERAIVALVPGLRAVLEKIHG